VDGKEAGRTQSGGGLTWATVYEAGHMVPYDQPDAALAMLNRWLDGQDL
jgi:cathepsin A (carboxypeptidase C)